MVLSKIDLLGTSDFDADRAEANARAIAPHIEAIRLSCRTGSGLDSWTRWLEASLRESVREVAEPA
jgi:hydrogenase nickel incorporation protein HypB